jgi:HEAT repeat protein
MNYSKKILPAVEDALKSPNYDKVMAVGNVLTQYGDKIIPLITPSTIYQMLQTPEYHIKNIAIQLLAKYYTKNKCPNQNETKIILSVLKDPDYEIQARTLEFISVCAVQIPPEMIFEKLHHPNSRVQSAAAVAASKIKLENLSEQALPSLLKMLDSNVPEIRISVMEALSRVGQFDQHKIPIKPFVDSLFNVNEKIRNAAVMGVMRYLKENPKGVDLKPFLAQIKNKDIGIQKGLLQVLGAGWKQIPDKIIPYLIKNLRSPDSELKEISGKILTDIATDDPLSIVEKLINEQETESYIRKGMIASTIIQIGNKNPKKVMPYILNQLNSTNATVQANAISVLSEISEKSPGDINVKQLITLWMTKLPTKTKKEIAKTVVNVVLAEPEKIKPYIGDLTKGLSEPDKALRKTIAKLFVDLGEKIPSLIPLNAIKTMTADTDPNIREMGMNLIKAAGDQFPTESMQFLSLGLKDKEWNVKNAAAAAFGDLGAKFNSPEIFAQIKAMLKDPEKWTRMKALEAIQKIVERKVKIVTIDEAYQLLSRKNEEELFLVSAAKILATVAADDFKKAFPLLIKTLTHPNPKVREGMISGMVKLLATQQQKTLIPNLLKYLSDETEITLQQSIALLLKRIVKYESADIKNRVVSLLKIRCQMSQDPVICSVMSELEKQ